MFNTVVVEGSLAVGKSLFLEIFEKTYTPLEKRTQVIREPLAMWQNLGGSNLLELYNKDPFQYGFDFENYIFLTMTENHIEPLLPDKNVRLMERSLWSANAVFLQNLKETNKITLLRYNLMTEWYRFLTETLVGPKPDYVVYLTAPPEVLLERIKARGRPEEQNTPLEYLQQLHILYDRWIDTLNAERIPVLNLNTNRPLKQTLRDFEFFSTHLSHVADDNI